MRVDSIRTGGCLRVLSSELDVVVEGVTGANGWSSVSSTERSGIGGGMRTYITSGDIGFENFSFKDWGRKSAFAKRRRCVVVRFGSRGNLESRSLLAASFRQSLSYNGYMGLTYLTTLLADFMSISATYASPIEGATGFG